MNDKWLFLLVGLFCGWVSKIPFLIRHYREIKKDKAHIDRIVRNLEKQYKQLN